MIAGLLRAARDGGGWLRHRGVLVWHPHVRLDQPGLVQAIDRARAAAIEDGCAVADVDGLLRRMVVRIVAEDGPAVARAWWTGGRIALLDRGRAVVTAGPRCAERVGGCVASLLRSELLPTEDPPVLSAGGRIH